MWIGAGSIVSGNILNGTLFIQERKNIMENRTNSESRDVFVEKR